MPLSIASAYEAFTSAPGTRAMGMAGAFIGQADDSTAIWYNPAGLNQQDKPLGDGILEYGTIPRKNDNNQYDATKSDLKYLGVAGGRDKEGHTFGLAYFVPYRLSVYIPVSGSNYSGTPIGRVDGDYEQMSFAMSRSFGDRFSVGASLDYMTTTLSGGNGILSGYGYSLGTLIKLIDRESFSVKLGLVYRPQLTLSSDNSSWDKETGTVISTYMPSRPESIGAGWNIRFPVTTLGLLVNVNTDIEQTLWSRAITAVTAKGLDYTKIKLGCEIIRPIFDASQVAFHLGVSRATPDDTSTFATINSFAYGVGFQISTVVLLDVAGETRSLSGEPDKFMFWSTSASWLF
jgi:long-subunit fatty acid transport protein